MALIIYLYIRNCCKIFQYQCATIAGNLANSSLIILRLWLSAAAYCTRNQRRTCNHEVVWSCCTKYPCNSLLALLSVAFRHLETIAYYNASYMLYYMYSTVQYSNTFQAPRTLEQEQLSCLTLVLICTRHSLAHLLPFTNLIEQFLKNFYSFYLYSQKVYKTSTPIIMDVAPCTAQVVRTSIQYLPKQFSRHSSSSPLLSSPLPVPSCLSILFTRSLYTRSIQLTINHLTS